MRTRKVYSGWGGSLEHSGLGFPLYVSCKTLGLPSAAPRTWFFQLIQTLSAYSFICTMGQHALMQYSITSTLYLLSHSANTSYSEQRALWPLFFIYKLQARSFDMCCKDHSCAYSLSDDFSPCSVLRADLSAKNGYVSSFLHRVYFLEGRDDHKQTGNFILVSSRKKRKPAMHVLAENKTLEPRPKTLNDLVLQSPVRGNSRCKGPVAGTSLTQEWQVP